MTICESLANRKTAWQSARTAARTSRPLMNGASKAAYQAHSARQTWGEGGGFRASPLSRFRNPKRCAIFAGVNVLLNGFDCRARSVQ